jgi:hypothetical protein
VLVQWDQESTAEIGTKLTVPPTAWLRPLVAGLVAEPRKACPSTAGVGPDGDVAAQVLTAIREGELYVFTNYSPERRAELEERFAAILTAMDKAPARSPLPR